MFYAIIFSLDSKCFSDTIQPKKEKEKVQVVKLSEKINSKSSRFDNGYIEITIGLHSCLFQVAIELLLSRVSVTKKSFLLTPMFWFFKETRCIVVAENKKEVTSDERNRIER